jgi:hypothetical protein
MTFVVRVVAIAFISLGDFIRGDVSLRASFFVVKDLRIRAKEYRCPCT